MKTIIIQPTLTPCKGSSGLTFTVSPCNEFIDLHWGTTLFMRILRNRETAISKIRFLDGFFANLVSLRTIFPCFPTYPPGLYAGGATV